MNLRVAILSATGTARKRTIPAIRAMKICDIAAIHGRNESKLSSLAQENSVPRYFLDPAELLDAVKPDFVFVSSPPALHLEQIRLCLDRRIPVFCEKPLCLSSREAEIIRSLAGDLNVPIRVAHHLRHQPGVAALKALITQGKLGQLRRVSMQWASWLNDSAQNAIWKLDPKAGGPDAFYDAGIHAVDLLIYLFPSPSQVTAIACKFYSSFQNASINAVLLLIMIFKFKLEVFVGSSIGNTVDTHNTGCAQLEDFPLSLLKSPSKNPRSEILLPSTKKFLARFYASKSSVKNLPLG